MNYVIGKPSVLFLLRNSYFVIGTSLLNPRNEVALVSKKPSHCNMPSQRSCPRFEETLSKTFALAKPFALAKHFAYSRITSFSFSIPTNLILFLKIKINYLPLTLVTSRVTMIKSFGNKNTERIWRGEYSRAFAKEIQETARRKLRMLNSSSDIIDLRVPPSNKLEKLKGDLKEYYSIRVNNQWRIIFKWQGNNAYQVELIDYHK